MTAAPSPRSEAIGAVGRGGMVNLVGLLIYGGANFALVAVVTVQLGARGAGAFLVSVGIFTILQKLAELGAVTGLVRFISRFRATAQLDAVRPVVRVALVPVAGMAVVAAAGLWLGAPQLARWFADRSDAQEVTEVLRALAPFLAVAPVYNVVIQATRGFETMLPQVAVERVGRALLQPIGALVVTMGGGGPRAVAVLWGASFAVFLGPALLALRRCLVTLPPAAEPVVRSSLRAEFWRFTLPRSGGQLFEIGVQWADTLIIGALIGTEAAGIYAAGSRLLLLAVYVVDALIQVVGPRLSGLLAQHRQRDASAVLSVAAGWHTMLVWPVYLVVGTYASVILALLGDEFMAAEPAVRWLAAAALVAAIHGPSVSVILMGGRSSVALANTAVAFTINVVGNLLVVPRFGISGAGAVWAATIVVSSSLPAVEAATMFAVRPWRRETAGVALTAVLSVGAPAVGARLLLGDTLSALLLTIGLGVPIYAVAIARRAERLHLRELVGRPSRPESSARSSLVPPHPPSRVPPAPAVPPLPVPSAPLDEPGAS